MTIKLVKFIDPAKCDKYLLEPYSVSLTMSGVLFIVCIPTENEEIELLKSKPYINNNNINEDRVDAINEKANGEVCRGTSQVHYHCSMSSYNFKFNLVLFLATS